MKVIGLSSVEEPRSIDHRAVIAWERHMREVEGAQASTIRRRLTALSSLFKYLVTHSYAGRNAMVHVERSTINRDEGSTFAFSKAKARKILDAPSSDPVSGMHDRAILSVGLQVGFRRAEIAALKVGDLHQDRGYDSLKVIRKGEQERCSCYQSSNRSENTAYLEAAEKKQGSINLKPL